MVDGLDARLATPARMPRLSELATHDAEHTSAFLDARAVMPTRTDTNHVSLLTGTYAEAHGITGNAYWSRIPDAAPGRLDAAELIAVETLFTVAETTQPSLVTLGAFSKPKLARLFAAAPDRQSTGPRTRADPTATTASAPWPAPTRPSGASSIISGRSGAGSARC